MPYMVTLIVLEAVINWWMGKKHNVADSVTSISSGLIMTMVGMLTHGMMLSIYSSVHDHCHGSSLGLSSYLGHYSCLGRSRLLLVSQSKP